MKSQTRDSTKKGSRFLGCGRALLVHQGAADGRVNLLGEAVPLESEEEIAEAKKNLSRSDRIPNHPGVLSKARRPRQFIANICW